MGDSRPKTQDASHKIEEQICSWIPAFAGMTMEVGMTMEAGMAMEAGMTRERGTTRDARGSEGPPYG
jgi:hypothetical protein